MHRNETALSALRSWYQSCCDGDWEHQFGIKIDALDNPGWSLQVDLQHTRKSGAVVAHELVERSVHDWIGVEVKDDTFHARGGPGNLGELLELFAAFVEDRPLFRAAPMRTGEGP